MLWIFKLVRLLVVDAMLSCANLFCSKDNTSPWIGRRGISSLVKRAGRPPCGHTKAADPCTKLDKRGGIPDEPQTLKSRDSPWERALNPFPGEGNDDVNGLERRKLDPFPTDEQAQDQFIIKAVKAEATFDIVAREEGVDDINTGVFREVGGTGADDAFALGLGKEVRLTGCTSLIVMSQKGVWFGHFWETLAYMGQDDAVFKKQILDLINEGGKDDPDVQQSLKSHADVFRGQPSASAWIIQPEADDVIEEDGTLTPMNYRPLNTKLQETIFEITGINAQIRDYTPNEDNDGTAEGRALYQYDPQAREEEPRRGFRYIWERNAQEIVYF